MPSQRSIAIAREVAHARLLNASRALAARYEIDSTLLDRVERHPKRPEVALGDQMDLIADLLEQVIEQTGGWPKGTAPAPRTAQPVVTEATGTVHGEVRTAADETEDENVLDPDFDRPDSPDYRVNEHDRLYAQQVADGEAPPVREVEVIPPEGTEDDPDADAPATVTGEQTTAGEVIPPKGTRADPDADAPIEPGTDVEDDGDERDDEQAGDSESEQLPAHRSSTHRRAAKRGR